MASTAGVLPQLPLEVCIPILDSLIAGDKKQPDGSAGLGRGWAGSSQMGCSWLESLALQGVDFTDTDLYEKLEHIAVHGEWPRSGEHKGDDGKHQTEALVAAVQDAARHCTERYRLLNTLDKLVHPLQAILVGGDGLAHSNVSITLDLSSFPLGWEDDWIDGWRAQGAQDAVPGLPEYTFRTVVQQPVGTINERLLLLGRQSPSAPLTRQSLATALYLEALRLLLALEQPAGAGLGIDITGGAVDAMWRAAEAFPLALSLPRAKYGVVLLAAAWLAASPNLTRLCVRACGASKDASGHAVLTHLFLLVAEIEATTGLTICPDLATLRFQWCCTAYAWDYASLYFLKPMLDPGRRRHLSAVEVDFGGYNGAWRLPSDALPATRIRHDEPGTVYDDGSWAPHLLGQGEREDAWIGREALHFWRLLLGSRGNLIDPHAHERTIGRPSDAKLLIRRGAVTATLPFKPRPFSANPEHGRGWCSLDWSDYCLLHPDLEELCLDIPSVSMFFGHGGRLTALPRLQRLHTLSISTMGLWGHRRRTLDEYGGVDVAADRSLEEEDMQFDRGTGIHQLLPPNIKHLTLIDRTPRGYFYTTKNNYYGDRLMFRTIVSILADLEFYHEPASLQTISVIDSSKDMSWRAALQVTNGAMALNLKLLEKKCRSLGITPDFDKVWNDVPGGD